MEDMMIGFTYHYVFRYNVALEAAPGQKFCAVEEYWSYLAQMANVALKVLKDVKVHVLIFANGNFTENRKNVRISLF